MKKSAVITKIAAAVLTACLLLPATSVMAQTQPAQAKASAAALPGTSFTKAVTRTGSATLVWKTGKEPANSYCLQISRHADFHTKRTVRIMNISTHSWELQGLARGKTYYARIRTENYYEPSLHSKWSKNFTFTAEKMPAVSDEEKVAAHNIRIAARMLEDRISVEGLKNMMVSPVSLYEDLAMAGNGAKGETRKDIERYLGCAIGTVNSHIQAFNDSLPSSVHVANSIWTNEEFGPLKESFLTKAQTYYNAEAASVPFTMDTVDLINGWVNEHTNGLIDKLIEELWPDEVMHLINAVSFDTEWKDEYETENIRPESFVNADSNTEKCTMLYSSEKQYLDLTDASGKVIAFGFVKPYKDNRTAFIGLLPQSGFNVEDVLSNLTAKTYMNMMREMRPWRNGHLHATIPEFSSDDTINADEYMRMQGMGLAFSPDADFSGLLKNHENLYIDKVLQKTHITVDRHGTQAAAATDIAVKEGAALSYKDLDLYLNRPFVYIVADITDNTPYFVGVQTSVN